MSVLNNNRLDQIEFCEEHWPVLNTTPANIGLTGTQVLTLKSATEAARLSYNNAQTLRATSKAGTTTFYANTGIMCGVAADLIRQI